MLNNLCFIIDSIPLNVDNGDKQEIKRKRMIHIRGKCKI